MVITGSAVKRQTLSASNSLTDAFKFNTAFTANTDKITDFVGADDSLQLENSIFTKLTKTGVEITLLGMNLALTHADFVII